MSLKLSRASRSYGGQAIDGHYGVTPDILVMAKGLASGMPLSAVATRAELSDRQPPGSMGGTYAGNAVACAAACATLDVFEQENLVDNAADMGRYIREALHDIVAANKYPVRDIRGLGLMIGIEFEDTNPAAKGCASKVANACIDRDMRICSGI
eukprot:m.796953 g.796953  ORF g.796953 m.796953 type:complete len:154 (-) comp23345_c1_seq24:1944-2405(-)